MCVAILDNAELVKKVVPERRIVWVDLPLADAISFDDLVELYRLHKVNFYLPNFNLSMVQEFYSNIPSNFPESAYANLSTPLVKGQVLKSHLKPFYKIWYVFIHRNVLGTSNNAHGNHRLVPPTNACQDRKIAYLESEINSLRKQFVDFKSLPSLCLPKLVLQHPVDPSSVSFHTVASSDHSSVVAAKMVVIYIAKEKGMSINVHQHFSSFPTSKGKHTRFTYSSNKNEYEESLSHGPCLGDVPVEDAIVAGSLVGSDD
ncbi:S ribonuclease [Pyrus ussuriensis x Pyrus communis]|uniref:S ribonuclease n=1 Tax=Pyrus ussuriensis x Pyrus communis TaxID=2448454 RepID=A0A5N5F8T8_9ROSA|nr:S ribonuclease [Pyrus ussuriensis x Pyrus communis]